MEAIAPAPLFLVYTIFTALPRPTSMQTSGTEANGSSVISYSLALYILIGIAVVYFMLTLICCILAALNCVLGRKSKKGDERATPYRIPLRTRLDTINEESECSRTSSQVSIPKKHRRNEALSFSNKSALEDLENEPQTTETPMLDEPGGTNLAFANKYALELARSNATEAGVTEDPDDGLTERGATITTSFRNLATRNINGSSSSANKDNFHSSDSPLMRYNPRSVTTPPGEVKVPFSEDETAAMKLDDKRQMSPHQSPHHSNRPIAFKQSGSPGSPFHRRKNPTKEIPSIDEKADLTDFGRKASTGGRSQPNSNRVHPGGLDSNATGSSRGFPPLMTRGSPDLKWEPVSAALPAPPKNVREEHRGSPIRSRPVPTHPVRSSLSQSPFLARAAKVAPSIATHNTSSAKNGPLDTPRSSSSASSDNILTAETMMKELQPVKRKWYIIGRELGFPARQLNIIKAEGRNSTDKCFASFCEQCMESSKEVTWQKIVGALRTPLVDEKELANNLECWIESSNSKTWL